MPVKSNERNVRIVTELMLKMTTAFTSHLKIYVMERIADAPYPSLHIEGNIAI